MNDHLANDGLRDQLERLLAEPLAAACERERTAFARQLAGHRLVLFGCGSFGQKALACLRSAGIEPLAFADNNPARWASTVQDVPVLSPAEAARSYGASALFVVTIWSRGAIYAEIGSQLESLGCRHVASQSALRWRFAERLLPDYCQDLPHQVIREVDEARQAAWLWADTHSQRQYLDHLRWHLQGEMAAIGRRDPEAQYLLDSLYDMVPGEVFLDCGAYTGDTAEQVIRRRPDFGRIFAVEADPGNFRRLEQWRAGLPPAVARRIEPMELAVGAARARLAFHADAGEGGCLTEGGGIMVDCLPIDELPLDPPPTFIKMDVEGAELDALRGAAGLIRQHHPLLAICVYHRQSDLWRIPLFIHSLAPDYRFFLRAHEGDGWELVCYAVPPPRLRSAG